MPNSDPRVIRLEFLDGLRGWASVFVLLFHVFAGGLQVDEDSARWLPYLIAFNGNVAVYIFFLVSGFSLSVGFLRLGDFGMWLRIAAGRYIRLTIPILTACGIVHLLLVFEMIDPLPERLAVFRYIHTFTPTTIEFFRFSLYDVFFNYNPATTYIGPLWTMRIELAGSFAVLTAILILRPLYFRIVPLLMLAALALWWREFWMLCFFFAGAAVADGFLRGWFTRFPQWLGAVLIAVGCLSPFVLNQPYVGGHLTIVSILFVGCLCTALVRHGLQTPLSRQLGELSFPLYLLHGPVMVFVGGPLTQHFGTSIASRLIIDLVVVFLSFVAAFLFLPVNTLSIVAARRFGGLASTIVMTVLARSKYHRSDRKEVHERNL